jgi:peptidoglycan/LPS O-acetylase OafA/YrhL
MIASNKVYLKGINGLRAIAALSVVISHTLMPEFGDFGLKTLFRVPLAGFGVTLFFVISGFLITYLLLIEKNIGVVDVRKFYIRRILRIWPIYYLIILLTILATFYFKSELNEIATTNLLWYIFFTANIPFILSNGIPLLVHFWSIGVEEQFYLLWPWVFKLKIKSIQKLIIFLIIILIAVKIAAWVFLGNQSILYRSISVTRIHCMLIGSLGAIYYFNDSIYFIKIFINKWTEIFAWLSLLLTSIGLHLPAPISHEFFALISLILVISQIKSLNPIINLENSIMNFLGKISYGMYVYHVLIIFSVAELSRHIPVHPLLKYPATYASVLFLTIVISTISYEYFESFFLKLKIKYSVILSSPEPEKKHPKVFNY